MNLTFFYKKDKKILIFQDITEIKKAVPDADLGYLYYLKALTLNTTFQGLIRAHRKEFGIPENGFEYSDKDKVPFVKDLMKVGFNDEIYTKVCSMLFLSDWKKLKKIYIGESIQRVFAYISLFNRAPIYLKTHVSWTPKLDVSEDNYKKFISILKPEHRANYRELYNSKFDPPKNMLKDYEDIFLSSSYYEYPFLSVLISIDSAISLNNLTRYLKTNWKAIRYYLSKMEDYNDKSRWKDFFISDRDLQIVEMHRFQKMSFKAIGDYYETQGIFDLFEDNVKTAYHRAVKKIDDLITPKV